MFLLVQFGLVWFSRVSKVRVGIRVSIRIMVSLVLVTEWGSDFPIWSEGNEEHSGRNWVPAYNL